MIACKPTRRVAGSIELAAGRAEEANARRAERRSDVEEEWRGEAISEA